MSYISSVIGSERPNFLDSEIGIVTKTRAIPQTMGAVDGTRNIVPAGTIFPANDGTAEGIVFHDVDVTNGDAAGSVMVAGRVLNDRLPTEPVVAAVNAMETTGLIIVGGARTETGDGTD